ncbi:hypothetical protein KAH51_15325 [Proteus vulgaris]|uniref:hypothetical protein n=1 Tax=Proteus TaxID=583 RepID=UPI001B3970FB|nr:MULTISPECIES: hypothetical protein [Proteus]MBQ0214824.1 hypothetical protein [Proteus vulgaris]MDR9741153.1 hypothetical protein [Proteus terrae]
MKFYVHAIKQSSYWELVYNDLKIASPAFSSRMESIDNLEETILYTEQADLDVCDDKSLIYFKFEETSNGWHWIALSDFNSITNLVIKQETHLPSYETARLKAEIFKNEIISSPIVDSAGVLIPNMHFSKEFSSKFDIGDLHPSARRKHF